MARPLKQTVDYFPHSCTSGKTLFTLENRFGNDGYAFWFKLLELLGISKGHVYDYNNPADWQFMVAKTHVSEALATNILQTLIDLEAIDPDLAKRKIIWCQHFVDNVADAYRRRQLSLPQKPGKDNQYPNSTDFNQFVEELRPEYLGLDLDAELVKFNLYWSEGKRKLQRPKLAFKNWLTRAKPVNKPPSSKVLPTRTYDDAGKGLTIIE
jgi:hypothetical protein